MQVFFKIFLYFIKIRGVFCQKRRKIAPQNGKIAPPSTFRLKRTHRKSAFGVISASALQRDIDVIKPRLRDAWQEGKAHPSAPFGLTRSPCLPPYAHPFRSQKQKTSHRHPLCHLTYPPPHPKSRLSALRGLLKCKTLICT